MTTQDDFRAALDAHPDDHNARLILGDALEEAGGAAIPGGKKKPKNSRNPP